MVARNPAIREHQVVVVTASNGPAIAPHKGQVAIARFSLQHQVRPRVSSHYGSKTARMELLCEVREVVERAIATLTLRTGWPHYAK